MSIPQRRYRYEFGAVDAIEVGCCIRDVTFSLKGRTAYVAAITAIRTTV
jgi:hypothetical protein